MASSAQERRVPREEKWDRSYSSNDNEGNTKFLAGSSVQFSMTVPDKNQV